MTNVELRELNARIEGETGFLTDIREGMRRRIMGQERLTELLLTGLLSGGHILLEGVPGLAKTLAVKTLSALIDGQFSRIQFTPDLLPADLIGTIVYSQHEEAFHTKKGPVFANFILADEINRAPAKVQSALLEAMEEHQVTIGEETFPLPQPFLVLATQNPIDQEGTYALPEAQVDRFMLKAIVTYPAKNDELSIIRSHLSGKIKESISPIVTLSDIRHAQEVVADIYLDDSIAYYITDLVDATRHPAEYGLADLERYIAFGGSPRASINLALAARTTAFLHRRGYVVPEDVHEVAHEVIRHRIGLTYEAEADSVTGDTIIAEIINKVKVP